MDETTTFVSSDFRSTLPRFTPEALRVNQALIDFLGPIAQRKKATLAQIAHDWLVAQKPAPAGPCVFRYTKEHSRGEPPLSQRLRDPFPVPWPYWRRQPIPLFAREWNCAARVWAACFQSLGEMTMSKRERMNVKVDADLVRKAKVVAAAKQVTLSDYISALLRPQIETDLTKAAAGLIACPSDNSDVPAGRTPIPN